MVEKTTSTSIGDVQICVESLESYLQPTAHLESSNPVFSHRTRQLRISIDTTAQNSKKKKKKKKKKNEEEEHDHRASITVTRNNHA
jgi:hypothetical protein